MSVKYASGKKSVSVTDYKKITDFAVNVDISNRVEKFLGLKEVGSLNGAYALQIYSCCERTFVFSGVTIYELVGKNLSMVGAFDSVPDCVEVVYSGKSVPLFIGGGTAVIANDERKTFTVSQGSAYAFFDGRLWSASGNRVSFSKPFSVDNLSVNLETDGYIDISGSSGEILAILNLDGALVVVSESSIHKISTSANTIFTLETIVTQGFNAVKNTVATVGGKVVFICDNSLFVLENSQIKVVDKVAFDKQFYIRNRARSKGGKYLLHVVIDNAEYIFVYDLVTGKGGLTSMYGGMSLADGGIVSYTNANCIYELDAEGVFLGESVWKSKALNFGSHDKKSLVEVGFFSNEIGKLVISGDFGQREFSVYAGFNKKLINLTSVAFTFTFTCGISLLVDDLKMKYISYGE